jgi:hypothetical protein
MAVWAVHYLFPNSEMNKIHASFWHVLMCEDCNFRSVYWFVHLCNKLTDSIITKNENLTLTEFGCFPDSCHCGKQDGQCKYYTTWRAYLQPFLQWKNNKYYIFWMLVCSLCYPACNAHAPYCHPWWPVDPTIFFTLSYEWHDFRKKKKTLLNVKLVLQSSLHILSETIFFLKKKLGDMQS